MEESGPNRAGILALVLPDCRGDPGRGARHGAVVAARGRLAAARDRRHRGRRAAGAALLLGTLLLVTTPSYPWYALPLVACAVLAERLEWLAVAGAASLAYASVSVHPLPTIAYAASAVVVLAHRAGGGVG